MEFIKNLFKPLHFAKYELVFNFTSWLVQLRYY